jgi:sortase A
MKGTTKVMYSTKQIFKRMFGWRSGQDRGPSQEKRGFWKWLEISLLVTGLVLVGFYGAAGLERYVSSRATLSNFQSSSSAEFPRALPPMEKESLGVEIQGARVHEDAHASVAKPSAARQAPLGVLEIPSTHLRAPILEGTDAFTLNRGVGRIAGTARPGEEGNIGIAGHRDSFFRVLKDVKAGDSIMLKTTAGIDTYVVDRLQIVSPRDVYVLQATTTPSLTLVTCYPFYFVGSAPKRFVVTAYLTNHAAGGSTTSYPRPFTHTSNSIMEDQ